LDFLQRTDLASESRDLWRRSAGETTALPGVLARKETLRGLELDRIEILDGVGEATLGKPAGRYLTLRLDALERREHDAFDRSCAALAQILGELLALREGDSVLVVGLGNEAITPDALGPLAAELGFSVEAMIMVFSAGNGLVNMITPTSGAIMGGLALAKVEYTTWVKFATKLMVVLGVVCVVILTVAMIIL